MRLFTKLLLLLSAVSLLPLAGLTLYDFKITKDLGHGVAMQASAKLVGEASEMLRQAVEIQARLVQGQSRVMETIVDVQAREMERLLAEEPKETRRAFFSEDFDSGRNLPEDMATEPKYARVDQDGKSIPCLVSFAQPDFKLAPGVERGEVSADVARLASMTPVYQLLYRKHSDFIIYQFTALESGIHSCYPGMGGYPEEFDPRSRPWYIQAKAAGELTWIKTRYLDSAGMGVLRRVAKPVYRPDGSFAGVTAVADCTIQKLGLSSQSAPWASNLQIFLALKETNPETGQPGLLILGKNSYQREIRDWKTPLLDEWLESEDREQSALMIANMGDSGSRCIRMGFDGRDSLWAYSEIDKTGLALILIAPMEGITANARELQDFIFGVTYDELKLIALVAALLVGIVIAASFLGSRAITAPLQAVAKATEQIAVGNLDAQVPEARSNDEIGNLTRSVTSMQVDLKKHIAALTAATASRERIESELRIASNIQMSILPKPFPALPTRGRIDIFAAIEPAREVGGDLYDFFLIDERRLFFAIGDVSGKGVGAALFMAMAKTLMKSIARKLLPPHKILAAMNAELIPDNDACMFVTLLCGILDIETGDVLLSNAGHNPPLLLKKHGETLFLENAKAPFVGVLEEAVYKTDAMVLAPGDSLVMYTDGVTEAADASRNFYSAERLLEDVSSLRGASPKETIDTVMERVRGFCGSAPQFDDITMLVIRFNGRG